MMRHTVHLFIGEEMASIAEVISKHLKRHGDSQINDYANVVCWNEENNRHVARTIGEDKFIIEDDMQGKFYFDNLHGKIITIANPTYGSELYLCIYVRLYDEKIKGTVSNILQWINSSVKHFCIDVYGIADDVEMVFCSGDAEIRSLIAKGDELRARTKEMSEYIIEQEKNNNVNRFLLLQNTNLNGIGLNLDKNTLIRILGEYALLTTEQYRDVFPITDLSHPDVTSLGISELLFDKYFFTDYLLSHSYIYVMERENVGQHKMENPLDLLSKAKNYIRVEEDVLSDFNRNVIVPKCQSNNNVSKSDIANEFKTRLNELKQNFLSVINDKSLSLPEKRAMLALFIREDDELFDDNVLLEELPTIDDCFRESLNLFIEEENILEASGETPLLTGPRNELGDVYLPLEELKRRKADVRKSQSYIRNGEKRLREIEKNIQLAEDSKRRLTEKGFTFGETTYRLQHDIVEKPLAKTYNPSGTTMKSVDLRRDFSSVRNQKNLGSCTAFTMSSIFEYILNHADTSKQHRLSPRFLYYNLCKKNVDGTPIDNGSSLYDAVDSLGTMGICEETLCPYDDNFKIAPTDEAIEEAKSRLITEAKNVAINHYALISALAEGYPVAISLKIFDSFSNKNNGFIYRPTESELDGTSSGWHAMVICGYSEEQKIYIVRNSWSENFGDKGYCYIPFSYIEDESLCRQACIVTGVNCNEIKSDIIVEDVKFDMSSKDIEYSILRILIDEEKQHLKKMESLYDELHKEYIRLVIELYNKGKRDKIRDYAINRLKEISSQPITNESDEFEIIEKNKYNSETWWVLLAGVITSILIGTNSIPWAILLGLSTIGVCAWMISAKIKVKQPKEALENPLVTFSADRTLPTELKFICAGMLIDNIKELKDELEKKHKYLTSYIGNFSIWLQEEKRALTILDENTKPPFITILTENDFHSVFDACKDTYTNDLWLFEEFKDYTPSEDKIKEFKTRIHRKLRERVVQSYNGFSMFKYFMGTMTFRFLLPAETKRNYWMTEIERQSLPFVQGNGIMPNGRNVLLVKTENDIEEKAWSDYCTGIYANRPSDAFGGSPYKLTFVQVQGLKKTDVSILTA